MKHIYYILVCLSVVFYSCNTGEAPKPYGAVPSDSQVEWQKMEYYMFIHFGPNTFTDVEWGDGKEDPKVFDPKRLDCRQWAATAKQAGMSGIIITAKHHDGFCLWPSKYSSHTVRESAWKHGNGDILRELSDACKEYGLKFGVYLSPWDQNHPTYGTPEYNHVFANTLAEVYTNYGGDRIFEQWFDGANGEGPNGKRQVYDWDLFHNTVYKYNPNVIIFSDIGPGCRWMGNERGVAGRTNWSTLNVSGFGRGHDAPPADTLNTGNINGEAWVPAETDVSIRPGWFYSPSTDDKVKSVEKLMDIYYTSIGRNSNLLLNVPPNRDGLISTIDSMRLVEFRKKREEVFSDNLAKNAKVTASETRNGNKFAAKNLLNGKYDSYWTTEDHTTSAWLELSFPQEQSFNRILLQEYIPLGQRVAEFDIEYWNTDNQSWVNLANESTIGYKRILRFQMVTCQKIRINIRHSLACPVINNLEVYRAPEKLSPPVVRRDRTGTVTITCDNPDPVIYYTLDGTDPTTASTKYTEPFPLPDGGVVKAIAKIDNGSRYSEVVRTEYDINKSGFSIISPTVKKDVHLIDDNPDTGCLISKNSPVIIDLGDELMLKGFSYLPNADKSQPNIVRYQLEVSTNGKKWNKVIANGTFQNIRNNPVVQHVPFNESVHARQIRLTITELTDNSAQVLIPELGVVTR